MTIMLSSHVWQLILELEFGWGGAIDTYSVYRIIKNNNRVGRLKFSLWIEEALRKSLTHQRPYPTVTTVICNDSEFNSRAVRIV